MSNPVSAIGGAVSLGGSLLQSKSASKAAKAQTAAADAATAEQQRQFDITQANQAPFLQAGTSANNQLAYLMGLNPYPAAAKKQAGTTDGMTKITGEEYSALTGGKGGIPGAYSVPVEGRPGNDDIFVPSSYVPTGYSKVYPDASVTQGEGAAGYENVNKDLGGYGSLSKSFSMADYQADPGYAFRLSEGQKALDRAASARGKVDSGEAAKAAIRFGQDSASQEYGNAYNRYNLNQTNLYNRLAGISGAGQQSANQLAATGANTANAISGNINAAGNAQAAGAIAQGNAWSTGLNNVATSLYKPETNTLPWQTPGNVNPNGGYY